MGSRRRWQKRKAAARPSASSEAGNSVPVLKRKKNQPSASDWDSDEAKILKLKEACLSEEGKILKLKKEFVAANQASVARIPFFTSAEEEALLLQSDGKTKKTKKVLIKRVVPTRVMESFKARLFTIIPDECILTEDELAKHSQDFQESYAENMDLMNKMRAWQKALLEQYDKFGYAVDESEAEVTDDEDDDDGTVVK
jgi:hypothetical protein